jgi:hypothetical protein
MPERNPDADSLMLDVEVFFLSYTSSLVAEDVEVGTATESDEEANPEGSPASPCLLDSEVPLGVNDPLELLSVIDP